MTATQIIEGAWEEVLAEINSLKLSGKQVHVEVRTKDEEIVKEPQYITFGMFTQLADIPEEAFKEAEFHGDPDDGLDWSE